MDYPYYFHRVNTPADLELLKWHLSDDIFEIKVAIVRLQVKSKLGETIQLFFFFMDPDQDT